MLEIIAMTVEDGLKIEKSGGNRIELVRALSEGGLTPSYEITQGVINAVKLPVNVIIRPHSKSFFYKKSEIASMVGDIKKVKELGANGVVIGALDEKGNIDKKVLETLIEAAAGMDITFHRAIDELKNPVEGIQLLANYKEIKTVLTSGGKGELVDNISRINEMKANAKHIDIMVGGGLNFENLERMVGETKTNSFHLGRAARVGESIDGEIDENSIKSALKIIKGL